MLVKPYFSLPSKERDAWDVPRSAGFKILGWTLDGDVRGFYSVTTTATDFRVMGTSDIDGDGVYATYIATKSTKPVLIIRMIMNSNCEGMLILISFDVIISGGFTIRDGSLPVARAVRNVFLRKHPSLRLVDLSFDTRMRDL